MPSPIDKGDEITPEQREFMDFYNAMVALSNAGNPWWLLMASGFKTYWGAAAAPDGIREWITWFRQRADAADPVATELLTEVTKRKLQGE